MTCVLCTVSAASRSHTIALTAKPNMAQIRWSLRFISQLQFIWERISRQQVLLSCWASTFPSLEALLGNANKCIEVSELFFCSSSQQTPAVACSQLHVTHFRVFAERKGMAPVRAELLRCTDPLPSREPTDMERGFGDQVSWSVPGTVHLSTPGSTVEAPQRMC